MVESRATADTRSRPGWASLRRSPVRPSATVLPTLAPSTRAAWRRIGLAVTLVVAWGMTAASGVCQEPVRPGTGSSTQETPARSQTGPQSGDVRSDVRSDVASDAAGELPPTRTIYLRNQRGELVPVRVDANLEDFVRWLERQTEPVAVARPAISVAAVELTGTTDEQFARLDAIVRVEVTGMGETAEQALLFPLGLNEAVVVSSEIRGPVVPIYGGKDAEKGYRWWFSRNGSYEFQLKLMVPIRRLSPWRRLQLTLPQAPVSKLQLQIPEASPALKTSDDVVLETQFVDATTTQVRATGMGTRLDLQWQPTATATDQRTTLDVSTTFMVRGSSTGFLVEATQVIKALQGVFREFTVRLPDRCELLQVDGAEIRETRVDPENDRRITVELQNPTSGNVIVKWNVRLPQMPAQRTILEGFTVESARRQTGEIGLVASDGSRWTISEATDPHLERMNVGEMRTTLGAASVVRAYRFFDQPFRLPLELQSVAPFYDVRPLIVVYATRDELRLEGRYDIRTFRGQLSELSLEWPGWRTAGWKLESVQPAGTVVTGLSTDETDEGGGRVVISISDKAPSTFELRVVARMPVPRGSDLRMVLPRMTGPSTATARVVFLHSENVDAEMTPIGETVLRPLSDDSDLTSESLGFSPGLDLNLYRLETDERQVTLTVTPQPLRVSVGSHTQVELLGRRFNVHQSLQHRVEYERLTEFHLQVPAVIAQSVRFLYQGLELLPTWSEVERSRDRIARLTLPQPTLGLVDIEVAWEQPLPSEMWSEKEALLSVPLVTSLMGQTNRNVLEVLRPAWFQLTTTDDAWTLEHADDALSRWSAAGNTRYFSGQLAPGSGAEGDQFLATRATVQLIAEREGLHTYLVQIRLMGSGPHVNVQLPPEAIPLQFAWDGFRVPEVDLIEFPEGSRRYTLPWPDTGMTSVERMLTLEYRVESAPVMGMSPVLQTQMPKLPQCRWATRTLCLLDLPADQHLFRLPDGVSPLHRWERQGILWRRVPVMSDAEFQAWLSGDTVGPLLSDDGRLSHRYLISQTGPLADLEIRFLSSATTFLAGSGLALCLGFLLIKLPVLRSVLASLCLLCATMVLALWYLPQLELLLQPMLGGALLAALLGLQEYWLSRRAAGTILTLSTSPSDLRVPTADGSAATHSLVVRSSDSATIFREPKSDDQRTRSALESHAG